MKLLLDQNLSIRLVEDLESVYGSCEHVRNVGMESASDSDVWEFAKDNNYIVVSKDTDFYQRSITLGFPPKVVWIRIGNCTTSSILQLMHKEVQTIQKFANDPTASFLALP